MTKGSSDNIRRVYSSEEGCICPDCGKAAERCSCKKQKGSKKKGLTQNVHTQKKSADGPSDGIIRLRRETSGRGGKTVIVITGLPLEDKALKELGKKLKKKCGTGGSAKNGHIEIQGEHRELLMEELTKLGYKVKAAGG